MTTTDEFKVKIQQHGEGIIGVSRNDNVSQSEFEGFVVLFMQSLCDELDKVNCGDCGELIIPVLETEPPPPPLDLELIATAYDCDGPSHGNRVMNDAFIEAFFQLPEAPADELPKQIAIDSVAQLSVPAGMYELKLNNNAMVLLNGVNYGNNTTVDLQSMDAECRGWNDDNSSSWSLYPVGVNNNKFRWAGVITAGKLLGDAEWARINNSPRFDSQHLQFKQQGSKVWGSDYDLFFEYAKWNDSDVLISVPHLIAEPLSTFFLDALTSKAKAFHEDTGHKVYVKYSNDLLGDHGQCDWIRDHAGKFYPDDEADIAYARTVGYFTSVIHARMAMTWNGFQSVLPLGFDAVMLEKYRQRMPDNEVVWCRKGKDDRTWELLK